MGERGIALLSFTPLSSSLTTFALIAVLVVCVFRCEARQEAQHQPFDGKICKLGCVWDCVWVCETGGGEGGYSHLLHPEGEVARPLPYVLTRPRSSAAAAAPAASSSLALSLHRQVCAD